MSQLTERRIRELETVALRVREHIIRLSGNGGCFIGASLSCADLLVYLYSEVLDVSPDRVRDQHRDYLFLSKGHDVPALYGTLVELGYVPEERLRNHLHTSDSIYWHPNRSVPGVEFHSGSLGHLLSVAIGVAYDLKLQSDDHRVYVVLGDGELNEGSVWEACLTAAALGLDNLTAIVDRNGFQANVQTEQLVPLEPLVDKFHAFGWDALRIAGHSFEEMHEAFSENIHPRPGPSVIIADTVRGKGLPSIECRADRWFVNFTDVEVEKLLDELHGGTSALLSSETLMVR